MLEMVGTYEKDKDIIKVELVSYSKIIALCRNKKEEIIKIKDSSYLGYRFDKFYLLRPFVI